MSDSNTHVQIARVQKMILDHLGLTPEEAIFEFGQDGPEVTLDLITVNPEHNQSFLLHDVQAKDKVSALEAMLAYVRSYRDKENSFTLQWAIRGSGELRTSYFRGSDIFDVLRKFTFGRDRSTIVIYSVSLNPVT